MDINEARQHLLNRFPRKYRRHIVEFAKGLSEIETDVVVFTARKSACFFHCLEHLRLWAPNQAALTTDRLIDHEMSWLKGKRVAIVDEVIVSGTSLYRLWTALRKAGATSITVHALFVNKEWFVSDFFEPEMLAATHITLAGPEAQALGTTIVRAFYSIPRPYSIDYPMSSWLTSSRHQTLTLTGIPGWRSIESQGLWSAAKEEQHGEDLDFFRFEPDESHNDVEFSRNVGIARAAISLAKIRLYGRWESHEAGRTYHFRVVPYLILEEISEQDLERVFDALAARAGTVNATALHNSCTTGKSKLRVIQYVLAARLARYWCTCANAVGVSMVFMEDPRELSFIFPESIHEAVGALIEAKNLDVPLPARRIVGETGSQPFAVDVQPDLYLNLLEPFSKLYDIEIETRKRARKERRNFFIREQEDGRTDRLDEGMTLRELGEYLIEAKVPFERGQLSSFIDMAVDAGVAVPITVRRLGTDGQVRYSRAYRHGEETYIIRKDLGLFHIMLLNLAEETAKGLGSVEMVDRHLLTVLKPHRLTRLLLEKALVLFIRYAISKGIFPEVYDDAAAGDPDKVRLSIGFDLLGPRAVIGQHEPTEVPGGKAFVNWLVNREIIVRDGTDGYEINVAWRNPYGRADKFQENEAVRFATALASGITCMASPGRRPARRTGRAIASTIDDSLVALTTCENVGSTLLALGAELRRFDQELRDLGVDGESADLQQLVLHERFAKGVMLALNSGYSKLHAFVYEDAKRDSERISSEIAERNRIYATHWDDVWEAARVDQSGSAKEFQSRQLVSSVGALVQALLLVHWLRRRVLQETKASDKASAARRSLEHKASALDQLTSTLSSTRRAVHAELAAAIEKARAGFEGFTSRVASGPGGVTEILNEMRRLCFDARDQYQWIDLTARGNGKIPRLQQFDSIVSIQVHVDDRVWHEEFLESFSATLVDATRRVRAGRGSRAYAQDSLGTSGDAYFPAPVFSDGRASGSFLGENKRGAQWLGYIVGKLIQVVESGKFDRVKDVQIMTVLGLEDSRRPHRNFRDGSIVVPQSTRSISDAAHAHLTDVGGLLSVTVDNLGRSGYRELFLKELTDVLKARMPRFVASTSLPVRGAGGTFPVDRYEARPAPEEQQKGPLVAWVAVVEDEGAALLLCLENEGISYRHVEQADGKIVVHAVLEGGVSDIGLRIYLAPDQANVVAASLLANIASTTAGISFIVVSGICCSLGKASNLTRVVIPVAALDMQQTVQTVNGIKSRSKAPELRESGLQMVKWYLVERARRKGREESHATDDVKIVDNVVMVSDNVLLRDGRPEERHRAAAKAYSTQAIALDMETAGVFRWAEMNPHHPPAVVIKGMSDAGKASKKDDENRRVAGMNSMRISLDFIRYAASLQSGKRHP